MDQQPIMESFHGLTPDFFQNIIKSSDPDVCIETIHVSTGSGRGDNYTSQLYRVRAEGVKGSQSKWEKSFICKILPFNRAHREAFKSESLFQNEVAFYTHALPALIKFQSAQGCSIFTQVPTVYLAKPKIIVLEDLKEEGYVMVNRKESLDIDHCLEILKTLAQLHGVSLALKVKDPQTFNREIMGKISECLFREDNEEWYSDYYQRVCENAYKVLQDNLEGSTSCNQYLQRFSKFISKGFFKRMVSQVQALEPLAVLCHGDCWTNNFLFRYDDSGAIASLRMLDFQFARYGSPALDIVYLLFSCMSQEVRSSQITSLLAAYSSSLQQTLHLLACPISSFTERPLLDVVKAEVERCSCVGLGLAIEMIPICTCDPEQAPDLYVQDALAGHDGDGDAGERKQSIVFATTTEMCRSRITELIVELVDKGVI